MSNPLAYPDSPNSTFNPELVVDLDKVTVERMR
jgi:hypothetical protein